MAIKKALTEAKVNPNDVNCLIPCGLGIPTHDKAELKGLQFALGDAAASVPFAPIKGQIGNLAAGCGVDAATAVLAVAHDKLPAAINLKKPRDGQKLNAAPEARDARVNVAVASVYSLGGQNAALVFRQVQSRHLAGSLASRV
jgi:3-oxoacyl-(acyl-carrier-protein) synthase